MPKLADIAHTGDEWVAWDAADPDCETVAAARAHDADSASTADGCAAAQSSLVRDLNAAGYEVRRVSPCMLEHRAER